MAKNFSVHVNIGANIASSFSNAIRTVEGRLDALSRRFRSASAEAARSMRGIGEAFKGAASLAAAGGFSFGIKHALGDGAELAHEIQALKNAGRSAQEIAKGIAAAQRSISNLPTSTMAESIKLLNETTGAFGDYDHALENLEFNQRIGAVLQNSVGSKLGDQGQIFNSLVRAMEIRGSAADHHLYQREVEELSRAMIFTRGNFNPAELLNFAQMANPAIKNYSERFLTKIAPSLVQEFGGDRAGTRAGAWYNAIMGKTRDKRMSDAWVKLGLLDKKNVLTNKKTGDIIGWNPGAVKGTDEAMADPLAWTEKYLVPALKKVGINTDDQMSVTKELGKIFRNSEANRFANAITQSRDRKRLHKDEALINKVPGSEAAYWDTLWNDVKLAWKAFKSSFVNLGSNLTLPLMKPAAQSFVVLAQAVNKLALVFSKNPSLAKGVGAVGVALAGIMAVRLAGFVFGVMGLGRALVFLALAAPLGLAARLVGIASGIRAIAVASTLAAVGRLRALAAGIIALGAVGGSRAVLAALAGSFAMLGRAILALPLVMLKGALVGIAALFSPIGIAVAAVTTALAALGLWVYNNLSGIGTFFTSFGDAFMKALGPEASQNISTVVGWLKQAWQWVNNLLGPIDETGKKWASWGTAAGAAAGAIVTALTGLPEKIGALAKQGYDALVNFEWSAAGKALVDKIASGITGAAGALADALKGAVSGAWEAAKKNLGFSGSAAEAAKPQAAVPGTKLEARALGGPVRGGQPYLVGERGPEIFVPSAAGRIETNGVLNSISKAGGRAAGANGLTIGVDATAVEEAGKTATAAGAQLHAALDATRKPIVDTSSIDAATASAEKLKAVLASVSAGTISVGGEVSSGSGGDSSTAEGAVGRAARGGAAGAVGSRVASGSTGGAGSAVGALGRAGAAAPGGGDDVTVNGHRYRAGAGSEEGKQRVASWRGFLQRPLDQGGLGLEADKSRALVAMLQGESHANLNPGAMGDYRGRTPTAFGTAQWRLDRAAALRAVATKMGRPWSDVEAQQAHFRNEMLGPYRHVFDAVKAAPSGEHALAIGIDKYENPAKKALAYKFRKPYLDTLRRQDAQAEAAKPAVAAVKPAPAAAEAGKASEKKEPVALAGARAMGGPVSRGLSYLVGERGPEIFTPGASGGISTNSTLNRLADIGSRTVPADEGGRSPSIAPSPKLVAELRPQGGSISTRGDTSIHNEWHIHGADNPAHVQRQVEAKFADMIRQHESEQRGLLSD